MSLFLGMVSSSSLSCGVFFLRKTPYVTFGESSPVVTCRDYVTDIQCFGGSFTASSSCGVVCDIARCFFWRCVFVVVVAKGAHGWWVSWLRRMLLLLTLLFGEDDSIFLVESSLDKSLSSSCTCGVGIDRGRSFVSNCRNSVRNGRMRMAIVPIDLSELALSIESSWVQSIGDCWSFPRRPWLVSFALP